MAGSTLRITYGSTNKAFTLVGEIPVRVKPRTGETLRLTAVQKREDQLDAPWSIANISGLGVSRAGPFQADADNRCWEMPNMQAWPGMVCLAPQARTTTDVTGTRRTIGFLQFRNNLFAFADVAGSTTTETLQYWVASTGTWTDCTAVADFNTAIGGAAEGFPCVGMADQDGRAYALRTILIAHGTLRNQLIYSTDGTTWTVPDHVNSADCPGPSASFTCLGLVSILGVLYTATLNSSSQILLRQNAAGNNGVTWTTTATSREQVTAINGMIATLDYSGTIRPMVITQEGAFLWDGTSFYKVVDHINKWGQNEPNTGKSPIVWEVEGFEGGYLAYCNGRNLKLLRWGDNNTYIPSTISPTFNTQGLPAFRDGQVTALAAVGNVMIAAIGGNSSATTAGLYMRPSQFIHPLGWFGPFYDIETSNRQVRAMIISSYNDGTVRLLIAVDNGTANDTDILYFDNITSDPRTVSSYLHTNNSTSSVILPKNDRFLPEIQKVFRSVQVTGTNLSATNKVTDVFVSADAAPLASDGSWGTTLGEITANAGTVNFAGTPSGTGLSARAVQLRMDLEGGTNASPYIEGINVNMKTLWPVKYIRRFVIWAADVGSVRPLQVLLNEIEDIVSTTTDLNVTYGEETTAIVMEPWRYEGGPIRYEYEVGTAGSAQDRLKALKRIEMVLVDV